MHPLARPRHPMPSLGLLGPGHDRLLGHLGRHRHRVLCVQADRRPRVRREGRVGHHRRHPERLVRPAKGRWSATFLFGEQPSGTHSTLDLFFAVSFSCPLPPSLPPCCLCTAGSSSAGLSSSASESSCTIPCRTSPTVSRDATRLFSGLAARLSRRVWDLEYGFAFAVISAKRRVVSDARRWAGGAGEGRTYWPGGPPSSRTTCLPSSVWARDGTPRPRRRAQGGRSRPGKVDQQRQPGERISGQGEWLTGCEMSSIMLSSPPLNAGRLSSCLDGAGAREWPGREVRARVGRGCKYEEGLAFKLGEISTRLILAMMWV